MAVTDQVRLPDGRTLDVRVSGPAGAPVLVFHHGTPGASCPVRAIERAVHDRGLRLVTTSRPGYGGSGRNPGRRVVEVVGDTEVVLASLGVESCVVAGWSGGGPHALACAARLKGTAAAVTIAGVAPFPSPGIDWLAGMGEDNVTEFRFSFEGEERLRTYLDEVRGHLTEVTAPDLVFLLETVLPEADRAVLTDEFGEDLAAGFREGLRLGVDGWLDDDLAFVTPWGFALDEISIPVTVWQGSADLMVPFAHGQWLSRQVPGVVAHLEPGQGHMSIALGAVDQMLDELLAAAGWA